MTKYFNQIKGDSLKNKKTTKLLKSSSFFIGSVAKFKIQKRYF